jgi:uncharacterized NAD(P)/FAD-binding protein YdhS
MPCNSDYMNPTNKEKQLRKTNQLLAFALTELGRDVPKDVETAADELYGGRPQSVYDLCDLLEKMTDENLNAIVYDGRNAMSRHLANWWDLHKEADRQREAKKTAKEQQQAVKKLAFEKLTEEEREALGLA